MYQLINPGELHPESNHVFGAIWCAPTDIRRTPLPKHMRGTGVPKVIMQMRWDGAIGFPGGMVEPREGLLTALKRELYEEIGYDLFPNEARLLCTHADSAGCHTHCYEIEVSAHEFENIFPNAYRTPGFLKEVQGIFAVQVAEFEGNRGFSQTLRNNFKATSKLQLEYLAKEMNWL